jgi:hypothetical protein
VNELSLPRQCLARSRRRGPGPRTAAHLPLDVATRRLREAPGCPPRLAATIPSAQPRQWPPRQPRPGAHGRPCRRRIFRRLGKRRSPAADIPGGGIRPKLRFGELSFHGCDDIGARFHVFTLEHLTSAAYLRLVQRENHHSGGVSQGPNSVLIAYRPRHACLTRLAEKGRSAPNQVSPNFRCSRSNWSWCRRRPRRQRRCSMISVARRHLRRFTTQRARCWSRCSPARRRTTPSSRSAMAASGLPRDSTSP